VPAFIALVATGLRGLAVGACTLDIAVGQEAPAGRAICLRHGGLVDVSLLQQLKEDVMDHAGMILCACGGEQVPGDAKPFPAFQELLMVAGHDLLRAFSFLFSAQSDRCPVLVTAGDHEHHIALQTVIAGEDVCREIGAGDMSQMEWTVGIGPGNADKNMFRQLAPLEFKVHCCQIVSRSGW